MTDHMQSQKKKKKGRIILLLYHACLTVQIQTLWNKLLVSTRILRRMLLDGLLCNTKNYVEPETGKLGLRPSAIIIIIIRGQLSNIHEWRLILKALNKKKVESDSLGSKGQCMVMNREEINKTRVKVKICIENVCYISI